MVYISKFSLGEHAPRSPYNAVRYMCDENCTLCVLHQPQLYIYAPSSISGSAPAQKREVTSSWDMERGLGAV